MSSLSDIIASSKAQIKTSTASTIGGIKNNVSSQLSSGKRDVTGYVPGLINAAGQKLTTGVNAAVNVGISDIKSAAGSLLTGDFSGALNKITSSPMDVMSSLGKTFGLSTGSKLGSNGGVSPGNSLEGAMARSDPQLSFNWYALMPDVSPIGGSPKSLPWYFVEEATVPFRTFEVNSRYYQGRTQHYAGNYSVDSLRLAIYLDSTNVALNYLTAWNGAIIAPFKSANATTAGGGYGRPRNYKKSIFVYLVSIDKRTLAEIEYIGCWPTAIDAYSMNSGSSDRVVNHVNFSVDDVFVNLYGVSSSVASGILPFITDKLETLANNAIQSLVFGSVG